MKLKARLSTLLVLLFATAATAGPALGQAGALTVGSCAAAPGPGRAADVGVSNGDTTAGAGVACIGGHASSGGTTLVARVGSCEDGEAGSSGGVGDFGDFAGTLGTSGAGDDGSGFATLAAAQLPFTGLPLWAAALAGSRRFCSASLFGGVAGASSRSPRSP